MKEIIGVLLMMAGVVFGFYVGGYLCLFTGAVTVIEQIALMVNTGSIVASTLVLAIVKIMGAGAAGWLAAFVLIVPGAILISL